MIFEIIGEAVMITGFVVIMMLFIECLNVYTKGRWKDVLRRSGSRQMLMAVFLGLIPGCLGGFAVVSLFTHGMLSFGALTACMIATFGDEAFLLYAMAPGKALLLTVVLAVLAVAVGFLLQAVVKKFPAPFPDSHWCLHEDDLPDESGRSSILSNVRHMSLHRLLLLSGIALFAVILSVEAYAGASASGNALRHLLTDEQGLYILFVVLCAVTFYVVLCVSDHFLKEHLWHHILKGHFLRIFLWTFFVVLAVAVLDREVGLSSWVEQHPLPMLGMALLIGLIPQSGPHVIFITLFVNGLIPFSVLLANSVVQEGHAGIPLLAESKKGFVWMKAISVFVGLFVGLLGYFWEF